MSEVKHKKALISLHFNPGGLNRGEFRGVKFNKKKMLNTTLCLLKIHLSSKIKMHHAYFSILKTNKQNGVKIDE